MLSIPIFHGKRNVVRDSGPFPSSMWWHLVRSAEAILPVMSVGTVAICCLRKVSSRSWGSRWWISMFSYFSLFAVVVVAWEETF